MTVNGTWTIPEYVTHYYRDRPFQTLTELSSAERARVIATLDAPAEASHRLRSTFYFEQRLRYEEVMYEQFVAKGGRPTRRRPHYAVLGESEIWQGVTTKSVRIPLLHIPPALVSFTYSDSWVTFVDRDLEGNPIPRKPQYAMVYRPDELGELFERYGWPGERWKDDPAWEHDIYVEAQIWGDEPLAAYL